ncbi:hypothetical protein [Natrinema marinum]|nr:hypothetical protein [Natrinema marinum]
MSTASDTTDSQQCPTCQTESDPFYAYCRQCLAELPSKSSTRSIV